MHKICFHEGSGLQTKSIFIKVPGCKAQRNYFFITIAVVSILASTGRSSHLLYAPQTNHLYAPLTKSLISSLFRVGNVLVALRCVEVRDKSLSFGFQTVFMSLFAMLPSPIIYGAIIDNTCLLWQVNTLILSFCSGGMCVCVVVVVVDQHFDTSSFSQEECGETTNCLLYDTDM